MKRQKLYLDEKGVGTVLCPECHTSHEVNFSMYKGERQVLQVECPCGPVKDVELEFRKAFRKDTKLFGHYQKRGPLDEKGTIKVGNLSLGGIGFTVYGAHSLAVGDRLTVDFILDDAAKSRIEKTVEVRNVMGKTIGGKFIQPAGATDASLGFYLKNDARQASGEQSEREDIAWKD
ncbi:MAG: hypothetical protein AB1921_16125 [Thermodesulfobacteriota bacterium]